MRAFYKSDDVGAEQGIRSSRLSGCFLGRTNRSQKTMRQVHPDCGDTRNLSNCRPIKYCAAMITELLEERAALYVSGVMNPGERENFELILEFHDELRGFAAGLAEVAALVTLATLPSRAVQPSAGLKARILGKLSAHPQQISAEGFVMSGVDGLVQWVNPAFTAMCGYTLDELRGKNLGPILQGEKTDRETAARMRRAVKGYQPCRETILNYHKNGDPYWVEIAITPLLDDDGKPLWLVARERELAGHVAA